MNTRQALSIFLFLLISWSIHAQEKATWKRDFGSPVLWQEVTALGNLIVCTQGALNGVDSETGSIIWSKPEFGGIPQEAYNEVAGSPYITVDKGGNITLLEPFNGEIIFDSNQAGVGEIESYYFLFSVNGILIAGDKKGFSDPIMLMVDMSTGKVRWNIEEKFGRIIAANELSNKEILIVTLFQVYKINADSGDIIWKNATSADVEKMEGMGALGGALKAMAENMTQDMEFNIYFYKHPEKDVFYLGSENQNQSSMGSTNTVTYTNNYTAFNISDGSRVWNVPLEMKGKVGQVAFDKKGLIILPNDGGSTAINMFDYTSQNGLWGKKGRGIRIKGGVYDYIETEKGYLLVTTNGNYTFLNVLDANAGMMTFDKPVKVDGHVVGIVTTPEGILYITTEELNILHPLTGGLLFPKSVKTKPELTTEKGDIIYAFDTKTDGIIAIDKTAGTAQTLTSTPIRFEGREEPVGMELSDMGIFIHSDQNVAMVDFSGKIVFQNYFPAPRESGLKKALLYAQAVRAAYIGANAYYAAGALQNAAPQVSEEDAVAGAMVQGFGQAYEELGDAAADYTVQAFKQANQRFKATAGGRDFMIILADKDKSNALIKVSKSTGKEEGYIDLGKDKNPIYCVDDITSQVYQRTAPTEVTSYKF